jgi:hypothetical protein
MPCAVSLAAHMEENNRGQAHKHARYYCAVGASCWVTARAQKLPTAYSEAQASPGGAGGGGDPPGGGEGGSPSDKVRVGTYLCEFLLYVLSCPLQVMHPHWCLRQAGALRAPGCINKVAVSQQGDNLQPASLHSKTHTHMMMMVVVVVMHPYVGSFLFHGLCIFDGECSIHTPSLLRDPDCCWWLTMFQHSTFKEQQQLSGDTLTHRQHSRCRACWGSWKLRISVAVRFAGRGLSAVTVAVDDQSNATLPYARCPARQ